jgi:hypothetical protein
MSKLIAFLTLLFCLNVLHSQNTSCFASLKDYSISFPQDKPFSININDINGDGFKDLVFTTFSNKVIAMLGSASGNYTQSYSVNVVSSPRRSELKDINGDNFPDLLVLHTNNNCLSVLIGMGNGSFVHTGTISAATPTASGQIKDIKIADLNNDGFQDLCVSTSNALMELCVLMGNGNGTFMPYSTYTTQIGANAAIELVDINNDGNVDVIGTSYLAQAVIHYGNGTVRLILLQQFLVRALEQILR